MKSRQEIKALAREAMGEQRGTAILLLLVYILAVLASTALDTIVLNMFGRLPYLIVFWGGMAVLYVILVNLLGEFIKIFKREEANPLELFIGLKTNFLRKLGGQLWMYLWFFLWSLLLIIPGIIKYMRYYFTYNILADCPNVKATDAIKISMRITEGHKMDVFIFILSWIGWMILSVFTLGILYVVYVGPYMATADAGFYLELRDKALREGKITLEDLGFEAENEYEPYENN